MMEAISLAVTSTSLLRAAFSRWSFRGPGQWNETANWVSISRRSLRVFDLCFNSESGSNAGHGLAGVSVRYFTQASSESQASGVAAYLGGLEEQPPNTCRFFVVDGLRTNPDFQAYYESLFPSSDDNDLLEMNWDCENLSILGSDMERSNRDGYTGGFLNGVSRCQLQVRHAYLEEDRMICFIFCAFEVATYDSLELTSKNEEYIDCQSRRLTTMLAQLGPAYGLVKPKEDNIPQTPSSSRSPIRNDDTSPQSQDSASPTTPNLTGFQPSGFQSASPPSRIPQPTHATPVPRTRTPLFGKKTERPQSHNPNDPRSATRRKTSHSAATPSKSMILSPTGTQPRSSRDSMVLSSTGLRRASFQNSALQPTGMQSVSSKTPSPTASRRASFRSSGFQSTGMQPASTRVSLPHKPEHRRNMVKLLVAHSMLALYADSLRLLWYDITQVMSASKLDVFDISVLRTTVLDTFYWRQINLAKDIFIIGFEIKLKEFEEFAKCPQATKDLASQTRNTIKIMDTTADAITALLHDRDESLDRGRSILDSISHRFTSFLGVAFLPPMMGATTLSMSARLRDLGKQLYDLVALVIFFDASAVTSIFSLALVQRVGLYLNSQDWGHQMIEFVVPTVPVSLVFLAVAFTIHVVTDNVQSLYPMLAAIGLPFVGAICGLAFWGFKMAAERMAEWKVERRGPTSSQPALRRAEHGENNRPREAAQRQGDETRPS